MGWNGRTRKFRCVRRLFLSHHLQRIHDFQEDGSYEVAFELILNTLTGEPNGSPVLVTGTHPPLFSEKTLTAANLGQYPRTKSMEATDTQMERGKSPMSSKQSNSNLGGAKWTKLQTTNSKGDKHIDAKESSQTNPKHPFREVTEMCHTCDPGSSVRVGRGLCTKRAASQTIINTNQIVLLGGGNHDTPLL